MLDSVLVSQWESLFLVLVVIYQAECLLWLPSGAVAYLPLLGGRRVLRRSRGWLAGSRGGFLTRNPFPPLDGAFLCAPWPLSMTSEAVSSSLPWESDSKFKSIRFEKGLRFEASGRKILAAGTLLASCATKGAADSLSDLLNRLASLPGRNRASTIEGALSRHLDFNSASRRLACHDRLTARLSLVCNLLFAWIFAAVPAAVAVAGIARTWRALLTLLVALMWAVAWHFYKAHRQLYPRDRTERLTNLAVLLLSPPAAVRAGDLLRQRLLEPFHPLAVACALLPKEQFVGLASRRLRELHHPIPGPAGQSSSEEGHEDFGDGWFRKRFLAAIEQMVRQAGEDPRHLIRPPTPTGHSLSYCPRCHCQYKIPEGFCPDCGGVALHRF